VGFSHSISATRLARSQPLISSRDEWRFPHTETVCSTQPIDSVALSEALDLAALVLCRSSFDVVGHACIDTSRLARHDVHEEAMFTGHGFLPVGAKADPSVAAATS
jgi:hypothetical protein